MIELKKTTVRARMLLNQREGCLAMTYGHQPTDVLKPAVSGWIDLPIGEGDEAVFPNARIPFVAAEKLFEETNAPWGTIQTHRSLSVGDVVEVEVDGAAYFAHVFLACAGCGFEKLTSAPVVVEEAVVR